MRAAATELHFVLQQDQTCVLELSTANAANEHFCADTYQVFKSR